MNLLDENKILVNILTRTSNRPNYFANNRESVLSQTYKNVNHIVSCDDRNDLGYVKREGYDELVYFDDISKLELKEKYGTTRPKSGINHLFPNLYINRMLENVKEGWILILDDDDEFTDENSLQKMVDGIEDGVYMVSWRMQHMDGRIIPNDQNFHGQPALNDMGSPCFMIHSRLKHLFRWDSWSGSDYRALMKVWNEVSKKKLINEILVKITFEGKGKRVDIQKRPKTNLKKKTTKKLGIQIVNLNNLQYTRNCIHDLENQINIDFELYLVDQNSSEEGTKKYLDECEIKGINIIRNKENRPLNHIWNEFKEICGCEYLCFLNNDIELPDNFTRDSIEILDKEKNVAIVIHVTNNNNYLKSKTLKYELLHIPLYQGWDFTIKRNILPKIPHQMKIFGGDDYIFSKITKNGHKIAIALSSPIVHYKEKTRIKIKNIDEIHKSDIREFRKLIQSEYLVNLTRSTNSKFCNLYPEKTLEQYSLAVFVHVYYDDLWNEIKFHLSKIPIEYDLYVSTTNDKNRSSLVQRIFKFKNDSIVTIHENRGMDIWGFILNVYKAIEKNKNYKHIIKIHTKKGLHWVNELEYCEKWRKDNFDHLLGTSENIWNILNLFKNENIGMYGNLKYLTNKTISGGYIIQDMIELFSIKNKKLEFFKGSMFWIKWDILLKFFKNKPIRKEHFPLGYFPNGTNAHGIERLFTSMTRDMNLKIKTQVEKPLINILTRTSNRPNYFKKCKDSIKKQTYSNINHVICVDDEKDIHYVKNNGITDFVLIDDDKKKELEKTNNVKDGELFLPHNLYFNELIKYINNGWVLILDDDDILIDENVVETIVNVINDSDEDTLIMWQMIYDDGKILPDIWFFNTKPPIYKIGSPCFIFNTKWKNLFAWDSWNAGDYRVFERLYENIPNKKWIRKPLIGVKRGLGKKIDL